MFRIPCLLFTLGLFLLLPLDSSAQQAPSLLHFTWTINVCKTETGNNKDCVDPRKLREDTRIAVTRDFDNDFQLDIALDNPRMNIQIPVADVAHGKNPNDEAPYVTFEFEDFTEDGDIVNKMMKIELIRHAGQDTGDSCAEKLEKKLGEDLAQDGKHAAQCDEDNLIYWRIHTLSEPSEAGPGKSIVGTPGDGHGTGSDGTQ